MNYYNLGKNMDGKYLPSSRKKKTKKQVWENSSTSSFRGDGEFAVQLHSGSKSSKTGKIEILFSFQDSL